MTRVQAFTPVAIDNLRSGKLGDPRTPGLSIEASPRGKVWSYTRRIRGGGNVGAALVRLKLGSWPVHNIADARRWADGLNEKVERGEDPRVALRATKAIETMTLERAWEEYIADRTRGDERLLKPRTLQTKRAIYRCDIKPFFGARPLTSITADELADRVADKAKTARVRANRLAAELKVMFKWFGSREAQRVGIFLDRDPAEKLSGTKYRESKGRRRFLSDDEIGWFFIALSQEVRLCASASYRRGFLLMLLTGGRIDEIVSAPASEYRGGVWSLPGHRVKNSNDHKVFLGAWGRSLMATNSEWLIPQGRGDGHVERHRWYKVRDRLLARMAKAAGQPVEHWTPHDLRRTLRSNGRRLGIDYETREAMLNHKKQGLDERYDVEDMSEPTAEGWAKWEAHLVGIARRVGVADALGVPIDAMSETSTFNGPMSVPCRAF